MRRLIAFLSMMVCLIQPAWASSSDDVAAYNTLLKRYVSTGEEEGIRSALVDYKHWSTDPLYADAMKQIAQASPQTLSGKEAMAFWINAYNLLTIDLIIQQNEHNSIKKIGGTFGNPWKDYHWAIGGKQYGLDEIENNILRKMGDPRIHMAINCASLSCPDLRAKAYNAEKLDVQLDEQVKRFLSNDRKGMRITNSGVEVSKIFEWFEKDFDSKGGVVAFIRSYAPQVPQDAEVTDYLDYNWNLNGHW